MSKIIKIMYNRKKMINLIKLTYKHVLYLYSFQSVVVFNESLSDFHLPHTSDRMNRLFVFFSLWPFSMDDEVCQNDNETEVQTGRF